MNYASFENAIKFLLLRFTHTPQWTDFGWTNTLIRNEYWCLIWPNRTTVPPRSQYSHPIIHTYQCILILESNLVFDMTHSLSWKENCYRETERGGGIRRVIKNLWFPFHSNAYHHFSRFFCCILSGIYRLLSKMIHFEWNSLCCFWNYARIWLRICTIRKRMKTNIVARYLLCYLIYVLKC